MVKLLVSPTVREAGVKGRDVEEKAVKAEELVGGCTGNRGFVSRF